MSEPGAARQSGVSYKHTATSKPSDSFPGLTAIVTGGTQKSTGIYYDVAYDRVLSPPAETTGNGLTGAPERCIDGKETGTRTEYEEDVDIDQSQLGGGFLYANPIDGDYRSINRTTRHSIQAVGRPRVGQAFSTTGRAPAPPSFGLRSPLLLTAGSIGEDLMVTRRSFETSSGLRCQRACDSWVSRSAGCD